MDYSVFYHRSPGWIGDYKESAVLFLIWRQDQDYLVLEQRSFHLNTQPGDYALPGGRLDPGETPKEAALREAHEELGIALEDMTMLGPMDGFLSPNGRMVHAFVAETRVADFQPNPAEVARLLFVPIQEILDQEPESYLIPYRINLPHDFPWDRIHGGRDYPFREVRDQEFFYNFAGDHVWGLTARLIRRFAEILKDKT